MFLILVLRYHIYWFTCLYNKCYNRNYINFYWKKYLDKELFKYMSKFSWFLDKNVFASYNYFYSIINNKKISKLKWRKKIKFVRVSINNYRNLKKSIISILSLLSFESKKFKHKLIKSTMVLYNQKWGIRIILMWWLY